MSDTAIGSGTRTSYPDRLSLAEDQLVNEMSDLEGRLKTLKGILENLRAARKTAAGGQDIRPVSPEEYRGLRIVDALETYLRARRGIKIPLPRIIEGLVVGGVDPGKPRRNRTDPAALISQTIKISLPNNDRIFAWEPKGLLKGVDESTIFVWLAPSADEVKRRKKYPKKK